MSAPQQPAQTRSAPRRLAAGDASVLTWPLRWIVFALWYLWALITSSVSVLKDNLTPGQASTPGIARVPLACTSDAEVTLLSALITLTPGTLTIGVTRDPQDPADDDAPPLPSDPKGEQATRVIYVHGLYHEDPDSLREEIYDMERRMLQAMRPKGVAS